MKTLSKCLLSLLTAGALTLGAAPLTLAGDMGKVGLRNTMSMSNYGHSAVIKQDGTLWMWGDNYHGQLGNGRTGNATRTANVASEI